MQESKQPTIVVAVTFRDFKGTDNDKIQYLFLESLKRQTYTNWIMAVSLFGEKNVTATLEREGIPFVAEARDAHGTRFSMSEVIRYGIEVGEVRGNFILLWSTCDVMFNEHFFSDMVQHTRESTLGTSFPNILYPTVEAYRRTEGGRYFWSGEDVFFISGDVCLNPDVRDVFTRYTNDDWGATEYYLQTIGAAFCRNLVNLWPSAVSKVENNRIVTNESRAALSAANMRNAAVVERLAAERGLPKNVRMYINRFRLAHPFVSLPMKMAIWFQSHFRVHLAGVRYHARRLLHLP